MAISLFAAGRWFDANKLALILEKCKCIFLPKSYHCNLSFSISNVHLELLGVTIDDTLNFSKHIGKITKKVGNQLHVLSRLKNTLSAGTAHREELGGSFFARMKIKEQKII